MKKGLVVLMVSLFFISGCSWYGKKNKSAAPEAMEVMSQEQESNVLVSGAGVDSRVEGEDLTFEEHFVDGKLTEVVFYFGFDRSDLNDTVYEVLKAHAEYLVNNSNARLRIEGHTDERGSREYNIALGERRAKALEHALLLDGVSKGQISIVSYGEEKPAVYGHDESAWRYNRRGILVYEAS